MNPINFWSFAADPYFGANKISFHDFTDLDGTRKDAAVQGFNINRFYSNPEHREDVMAIRVGAKILDYPTLGFQYSVGNGSLAKFHYLGQDGPVLYYYYPISEPYANALGDYFEGIIQITLPFESGKAEIVESDEIEEWGEGVEQIRSIDLSPEAFDSLCDGKLIESRKFSEAIFGKKCS